MSFDGLAANTSGWSIGPRARGTGSIGCAARIQHSLPIGHYATATAEHREPYELRGSRTVLGAPEGESPSGDSSKGEILRLSIALPSYPGERTFGPCRHSALRRSGNGPCRRHASPADAPRNPHKFRQPYNLSDMVGVIDSISSDAALAETVGLCWPRWHLAIGSGRDAATMV